MKGEIFKKIVSEMPDDAEVKHVEMLEIYVAQDGVNFKIKIEGPTTILNTDTKQKSSIEKFEEANPGTR